MTTLCISNEDLSTIVFLLNRTISIGMPPWAKQIDMILDNLMG